MALAHRDLEGRNSCLDHVDLMVLRQGPGSLLEVLRKALAQDDHAACQPADEGQAASLFRKDRIDPVLLVVALLGMRLCPMVDN